MASTPPARARRWARKASASPPPLTATANNYCPAGQRLLSNPFPTGFLQPAGIAPGLLTYAGQTLQFLNPKMKNGYSLRWNFDIQQSWRTTWCWKSRTSATMRVHLPVNVTQLNGIPRQYLSTLRRARRRDQLR